MGDADGEPRDFLDNGADLDAAIGLAARELALRVVLWGLCDGASAAAVHVAAGRGDARVAGLVMVNPWIRTEAGAARVRLRRYYLERLRNPDLFGRLLRGRLDALDSLRSFAGAVRNALSGFSGPDAERDLPTLVLDAVAACEVPVLVAIAEADETAREFQAAFDAWFPDAAGQARERDATAGTADVPRLERRLLPGDHTFSREEDRERLEALTADWVGRLARPRR